ncbi:MAG: nuclear transport factor 2 family protein [Pirellulales bacterium]
MSKTKWKLMLAGVVVACAFGVIALIAAPPAGMAQAGQGGGDHGSAQVARLHDLHAAFHGAISYNGDPHDRADNLDFIATLWAPDATLTVGGSTLEGRDGVLDWFDNVAPPLQNNRNWASLSPAYKTELDPDGKTADIYFECILVDPATNMVMGKTAFGGTAKKVHGDWVFWDIAVGPASL